jgi:hypothetical protein
LRRIKALSVEWGIFVAAPADPLALAKAKALRL